LAILVFEVFSDLGTNWVIRARYFQLKNQHEIASYVSTLLFISLIIRLILSTVIFLTKDIIFIKIFHSWSAYYTNLLNIQIGIFFLYYIRNTIIPILILEMSTAKYLILILSTYFFQVGTSLFLLISIKIGIASLFYGELIGAIIFSLLSIVFLKGYITHRLNINVIHDLIKIGLPSIPKLIIDQIQNNINKYFIMIYMSVNDLGIFQKSDFLYGGFKGLNKSMGNAVAPNNLKKITENKEDSETSIIIIQFLYGLSAMVLITTFYLEDIFRLMGVNNAFWVCAKYAPLYGYNILITSFVIMFRHNILISRKTKFFVISAIIGLITSVLSNIIMIPKYGIIGGIFSVILVSLFSVSFTIFVSERLLKYKTIINYQIWIFILLSVLIIYGLNYNGYIESITLKTVVLFIYIIVVIMLDKYFVAAINWNKILMINK